MISMDKSNILVDNYDNIDMISKEWCDTTLNYLGLYFEKIKDYNNMKKYYDMAIERGSSDALHNMGCYYNDINDYEKIINFIKKEKNFNNKNVEKSFNYNIDTISKFFWNEILLNYKNNIEVFYKNKNSYINGILI